MRKSAVFFLYLVLTLFLVVLMFAHASASRRSGAETLLRNRQMVRDLGLTDLCLFNEASYTRHLSLADLHSPFQDGLVSLDHFPSGSLAGPPRGLKRMNEKLD
jgi:hypothetical protein